jgi:hypothetical protein
MAGVAGAVMVPTARAAQTGPAQESVNLAPAARPSSRYVSGDTNVAALNSGKEPVNSGDISNGMFGTWPQTDTQSSNMSGTCRSPRIGSMYIGGSTGRGSDCPRRGTSNIGTANVSSALGRPLRLV